MAVTIAYLAFVPMAALCFALARVRVAILLVLIGGWLLLPVGHYPPVAPGVTFPWWINGIALPTDMLLTKAWIPPLAALAGAAARDWPSLRDWRPAAIDLPMIGWCLWPLVDGLGGTADPAPWLAAGYVTGAWGVPWLIGRVWFAGADGGLALLRALTLSGLANLPVAIIEAARPPFLYAMVYGRHPFSVDGIERYIGYRPVGFLEDGNLYGLWTALAAFAALALVRNRHSGAWIGLAVVNVTVALASQSIGAILLLALGLSLLTLWRLPIFLPAMAAAAALLLLGTALHFAGVLPLQAMAHTPAGEKLLSALRSIGRGSLLWRVSQDTKTLASVAAHPIAGTAQWDWWRPYGTRPWGQPLLLLGQYGLVGLLLAWGALLGACVAALAQLRQWRGRRDDDATLPLVIIVLLALADATLNAFFFAPAILTAGAIAAWPTPARKG